MADTRGFEVVAEVKDAVLQEMLRAAWDNGGAEPPLPGSIPHEVPIPAGTSLGPYAAMCGQVVIPKEGLTLVMAPAANGVTIHLATAIQVNVDTSTTNLESLALLEMAADIAATAPFGTIPGSAPNIGVIFDGLPRANVAVTLTSGDPVDPVALELVREYVHGLYTAGQIPHNQAFPGQSYGPYTFDAYVEIYDDEEEPGRAIEVTRPDPGHVVLSLPTYVRLSNLAGVSGIGLVSPMAVTARLVLTVPYQQQPGLIRARLSQAVVTVADLHPAAGPEGANYSTAGAVNPGIGALFTAQLQARGQALVAALGDMDVQVPTRAAIEQLVGDEVHEALLARRFAGAWTPATPEGSPVSIVAARPRALSHALAIGINPGAGANESLLAEFVPPGGAFAIALDAAFVEKTIGDVIARPEADGGFGGIPKDFPDIEGHRVRLRSLSWGLQSGKIHFTGSCTVHDVFCGADADVDFWADVGLKWSAPDAGGAQRLVPYLIDSDASLPWWAWVLAVVSFFISLILGIIWLVITIVIDDIADKIGAAVMSDQVSGQVKVLGAWPQQLQGVGTVRSTFDEAVVIEPSGLVFTGSMIMSSTFALTTVAFANAHGPYTALAASVLSLEAGPAHPSLKHDWNLGDGSSASGRVVEHAWAEDGRYVVRVATRVDEAGGALTHQSARVRVRNVRPVVEAGTDVVVDEGEPFTVVGRFTDAEWGDTHEAVWDFGDDTLPVQAAVAETHAPPLARGTATASHAYCKNGVFKARLRVRDDDGGIGEDELTVRVENVAPEVTTDAWLFAYPCVPVTLIAHFVDPGWCDAHRAYWRFGDGDFARDPTPATVKEVHEPPAGYGLAAAVHTYRALATHVAECVVVDSDGAAGRAQLRVAVVDLMNKRFEDGFRQLRVGAVANEWTPFVRGADGRGGHEGAGAAPAGGTTRFEADELVVRAGQRAQRIELGPAMRGGIQQSVAANVGWDYQVTAHHLVDGRAAGRCLLGIDPRGGHDPDAASVVWVEAHRAAAWHKLLLRVTAQARAITVFLAAEAIEGPSVCWFDAVELEPFSCPLPEPQRPKERPAGKAGSVRLDAGRIARVAGPVQD